MLHILLLLLKIIGIIFLCILGMLILALLCVLFIPVRYRIEVVRREGENEPPVIVQAKITWLLHFLNVLVRYSTEFYLRVRLLFIPIFRLPRKEKKKKGKRRKKEKMREENAEKGSADQPRDDADEAEEFEKENIEKKEQDIGFAKEAEAAQPQNFVQKLRAIWEKIKNFFENIQYTIQNICDKIKAICNNIQYYSDLVKSDVFQNTYILCKKELCRIMKGILPGTFEADMVVGMDDPAATGQILAVCGMLYPVFGGHMNVVGDFDRKRLEGRIFMKGRIYGVTLLYVCVKIFFDKNVKKLYKLLKKEAD